MGRCLVRLLGVLVFVATLGSSAPALAQTTDRERAAVHFENGRKHRTNGRCDLAIEEFRKAIDFEPTTIGGRLNLADCYADLNKQPEAFRFYKEVEALALPLKDSRLEDARKAIVKIEQKLVRVVLREEEAQVPNLVVTVDGLSAGARPWPIVVSAKEEHTIEATAPDGRRWSDKVKGAPGEVIRLSIVLREPTKPPPAKPPVETPPNEPKQGESSSLATAGLVIGGIGAVALVTGAITGLLAVSWRGDLKEKVEQDPRCTGGYPDGTCDPAASTEIQPLQDKAFTASTISTISLIGGGILLGGGVLMYFLAPEPRKDVKEPKGAALRLRVGAGAAFLEGRF